MRKVLTNWLILFPAALEARRAVRIGFAVPLVDIHLKRTIPSLQISRFREGRSVSQEPSQPVTELLVKWKHGDTKALDALLPLVYKELKAIARHCLRQERAGHTLQSAALVHEAYLRLANGVPPDAQNRAHFAAVAARLMRQILVDYARSRGAAKRGVDCLVEFDEELISPKKQGVDVLALDDVLNELAAMDEQQGRIVELRFFGGLTIAETSSVLAISPATVKRDWNVAKAWLSRAMKKGRSGSTAAVEKD